MARTQAKCPNCGKKMKYLFELVYKSKKTDEDKKSNQWTPVKRAIYCNDCDHIYRLELEGDLTQLNQDITNLELEMAEKHKIE
jgi:hypothetical protein